jgi:glycosyltransferase involved in cell wall biosynthesis
MISLCTFVRNESNCLPNMINSVYDFVDEVIIVDTGSVDGTQSIVDSYPKARLYECGFTDFGKIRTLTGHLARMPWILMLDADETLSNPSLLKNMTQDPLAFAYALPRKRWLDINMNNQTEIEAYPDWQVRFYRNYPQHVWKRQLHEYFHGGPVINFNPDNGPIINHFQDVFKNDARKRERMEQYSYLALQAGVAIHGGKPIK